MSMHIRKEEIMKLRKKSGLISAVIALSCASLVSVGFASWVISQGDSEVVQGTILVDDVSDQTHELTVDSSGVSPIAFKANAATAGKGWLTSTDTGVNLSAVYNITVTNLDSSSKITASLESGHMDGTTFVKDTSSTGYLKANADGLVGDLPTPVVAEGSAQGTSWKTTVTLTFTWGSHFGGESPMNPMDFYNAYEADAMYGSKTYAQDASDSLNLLKTDLTGVVYQLTINVAA